MADKFNLDGFSVSDADVCTADGGFVGDVTGGIIGVVSTYSTSGAIGVDDNIVSVGSITAPLAMTLGDSGDIGRTISITRTGSQSVTITSDFGANGTITFSSEGDSAIITRISGSWAVMSVQGAVLS